MPAIRWLRRDDALASPVRSHGHQAVPASKHSPHHPRAGLHRPAGRRPKTRIWGTWRAAPSVAGTSMRSERHPLRRPRHGGSATPRHSGFSAGPGGATPKQSKQACRQSQRPRLDRARRGISRVNPRLPLAIVPEDQSPALARHRAVHVMHPPETGSLGKPGSSGRTARPHPEGAPGEKHRRELKGSRSTGFVLAPAMVARMRTRRRFAARLSLARRGYFSPVRG